MTSAQVNGANTGLMGLMSVVHTNQLAKDSSSDFSKLMEMKSNPNDVTDVDMNSKVNETKPDSTKETRIENRDYDKSLKTVDDEEVSRSIEDTVEEVKAEIAEELDITVEELEQAMATLGMSDISLLDVTNLPILLAELTGQEPIMILTDADLSGTLNDLVQIVNENNLELANELNVLSEEIKSIIDEMETITSKSSETVEMQTSEGKGEAVEQNVVSTETVASVEKTESKSETEQNDARVIIGKEEVTVTVTGGESQTSTSENNLGGAFENQANVSSTKSEDVNVNANIVQDFAEQMLANIEEAVTEITYTSETVDAEGIMKQIVNHVKVGVSSEITSMELQLQPENLGKLELQVAMKDGKLIAEFTTENEAVKNVIEGQLIQLKETLEEQGIKVSSVEVSVEQQGLHQGMDENQGEQNEYQETNKQNVRKINLQGIRSLEEIEFEELDEDELITAQLMLQNGNTVDFTA